MQVHQLVAVAEYGDATTNEALALRRVFERQGPSHIFSFRAPDPRLKGVLPLEAYAASVGGRPEENVLLLHFAMGQPELFEFVMGRPERLVLRYHNVTPPEMFADFDPTFAAQLAASREEAAALRERVDLAIAVSRFNAEDLERIGYRAPAVVPLILDLAGLVARRPRRPHFAVPEPGAGPLVLFVGRLAPNKGHPQLLEAFHILKTYLRPDAHLLLAGSAHHLGYLLTLERFIADLRLPDVWLPGHVSDAELVALYRRADVFLCLSDHEGFGAPLLEAMAFGVPVVARAAGAIAETVGGAGIVLPDASPALAAEAVHRVLEDGALRARLVARGRARVEELRPEPLARRIRDLVAGGGA